MNAEPCGINGCPALATNDDGLCSVHVDAKRAGHVLTGTHCPNCHRAIKPGDWITAASTLVHMVHVVCPPRRPWAGRKRDQAKPLLEEIRKQPC